MDKHEMRDFVEGLFVIQQMTKEHYEKITQTNDFDKDIEGLELLSPKISYHSDGLFVVAVTFNKTSMAVRFSSSFVLLSWIQSFERITCENIKRIFNLDRLTITGSILNVQCDYENCREFLIWLFEEIDRCKQNLKNSNDIHVVQVPPVTISTGKLHPVGLDVDLGYLTKPSRVTEV